MLAQTKMAAMEAVSRGHISDFSRLALLFNNAYI